VKADIKDTASLQSLRPLDILGYLRAKKWHRAEHREGISSVWLTEAGDEVLLPLRTDFRDYALRMAELLRTLSDVEDRSQLQVFTDLLLSGADVLRIHLIDDDLADGTIPVEDYAQTGQGTRDIISAAACAALEPKAVWPNRKPKEVTDYMQRLRIGQSERGSYVITVISRVPPELEHEHTQPCLPGLQTTEEPAPPPFERRVLTTLVDALQATRQAAEGAAASGHVEAFEEATERGVSANLCEALAGLAGAGDHDRDLDFGFSWSPTRPVPTNQICHVTIQQDHVTYARQAGEALRSSTPVDDFELAGPIIKLERGPPPESGSGKVTVYADVEGKNRRVTLDLPEDVYRLAVDAHREGHFLHCSGRLAREKKGYALHEPRSVHFVSDDD